MLNFLHGFSFKFYVPSSLIELVYCVCLGVHEYHRSTATINDLFRWITVEEKERTKAEKIHLNYWTGSWKLIRTCVSGLNLSRLNLQDPLARRLCDKVCERIAPLIWLDIIKAISLFLVMTMLTSKLPRYVDRHNAPYHIVKTN